MKIKSFEASIFKIFITFIFFMSSIISRLHTLDLYPDFRCISTHRCFEEVQYTCFLPFHAAQHYWHFSFHTYVRMCCSTNERDSKFNLNSDHEEKKTYFHMSSKVLVTTAIKLTMHNFHYYPAEIYVYIRVYRWVYVLIGALRNITNIILAHSFLRVWI